MCLLCLLAAKVCSKLRSPLRVLGVRVGSDCLGTGEWLDLYRLAVQGVGRRRGSSIVVAEGFFSIGSIPCTGEEDISLPCLDSSDT